MDNPFAVQSRRRPPLRALKTLLVVVVGLVCLIFGNATAWRETGGY